MSNIHFKYTFSYMILNGKKIKKPYINIPILLLFALYIVIYFQTNSLQLNEIIVNNNPSSINLSTTPTSAIAILIVTENKNDFDNYALALNSLECYTHHYGYTFKIIDFEANTTLAILCPQDDFFFARHCAVYHYLTDNQDTIQFLFTLDADIGVINPTITFERYLPADGEDIVFSQRIFTHEIAASPYIVRNSHKGRQFLLDWSQYFWRTPSSFHGSDNGALMQLFVDKYVTDQLRAKKNECQYIYETLSDFVTFRKYCICSASILYKVGDTTTNHLAILFGNGSVKVLKRLPFLSPVRDVWETNSRFCVDDFLLHGWKMNTMKPAYHNFGAWDSQLHTTTINISKCNGPAFVKQWKYKEHLIIPTSKVYQTLATVANNTNNEYSTSTFSQIKEKSLRRDRNIYVKSAYATVNGQTIVLFTAHKDAQFNQLKGENNINPVNNNIFPLISHHQPFDLKYISYIGQFQSNDTFISNFRNSFIQPKQTNPKHRLSICTPVLSNFANVLKFISFIDYYIQIGATRFLIYHHSVNPTVYEFFKKVQAKTGIEVEIVSWSNLPFDYSNDEYANPNFETNYHFQQLATLDCYYRSKAKMVIQATSLDQQFNMNDSVLATLDSIVQLNSINECFIFPVLSQYVTDLQGTSNTSFMDILKFNLKVVIPHKMSNLTLNEQNCKTISSLFVQHVSYHTTTYLPEYKNEMVVPLKHWTRDDWIVGEGSWRVIK